MHEPRVRQQCTEKRGSRRRRSSTSAAPAHPIQDLRLWSSSHQPEHRSAFRLLDSLNWTVHCLWFWRFRDGDEYTVRILEAEPGHREILAGLTDNDVLGLADDFNAFINLDL